MFSSFLPTQSASAEVEMIDAIKKKEENEVIIDIFKVEYAVDLKYIY